MSLLNPLRWLPSRASNALNTSAASPTSTRTTPTLLNSITTPSSSTSTTTAAAAAMPLSRSISTTTALYAPPGGGPKKKKKKKQVTRSEVYDRVKILKQNMFAQAPPPLRMARLRYLRHWTIHRAWQLFRRQQREAGVKERERMHAGMYNACEELRATVGPGDKDQGYLYRVAMQREGIWGKEAVPIEYARFQTEYPGNTPWNHEWKRTKE